MAMAAFTIVATTVGLTTAALGVISVTSSIWDSNKITREEFGPPRCKFKVAVTIIVPVHPAYIDKITMVTAIGGSCTVAKFLS